MFCELSRDDTVSLSLIHCHVKRESEQKITNGFLYYVSVTDLCLSTLYYYWFS